MSVDFRMREPVSVPDSNVTAALGESRNGASNQSSHLFQYFTALRELYSFPLLV